MRRGIRIAALGAALALSAVSGADPTIAQAHVPQATLPPGGRAITPPGAPPAVKAMIEAANRIHHRPYHWGGGHRSWNSAGYDCSGSVSYVMHAAGLLESPLDSTGFMRWGGGGTGSWVRIYGNHENVFAVIPGLRWDTSMTDDGVASGPIGQAYRRLGNGFLLHHPLGLLQAVPLG